MADSLREEIRACIREELQRNTNRQANNQTLVERTRSLIQASASSASQNLSSNDGQRSSQTPVSNSTISTKRPVPGHPLRFSGKKQKKRASDKPNVIPKTVYLLDEVDVVSEEDYSITDSMILIKGECDMKSTYSEEDIRSELVDLFKAKFPLINKRDFDFVRRERNIITTPLVKTDHQWDFKHVKHLCGQGKLYVRLNVCKNTLVADEEEGISSFYVKSLLKIQEASKGKVQVQMLYKFIESADEKELCTFLAFLTGSTSCTSSFSTGCITVSVENIQGFFASTCMLEFKIPSHIEDYSHFENSIKVVLQGNKFTTI